MPYKQEYEPVTTSYVSTLIDQIGPRNVSQVISNVKPPEEEEEKPWWHGVALETGVGITTDIATGWMLGTPLAPLYYPINYGVGYGTNVVAQRLRGETEISQGEAHLAGGFQTIPMGTTLKGLKGLRRAVYKGAGAGLVGRQFEVGVDEGRVLTPGEAITSAGVGAAFGGTTKGIAEGVSRINTKELRNKLLAQINRGGTILSTSGQGLDVRLDMDQRVLPYRASFPLQSDKGGELQAYIRAAYDHRVGRIREGYRGRELMKGFTWNDDTRGYITDKDGKEWLLTRSSGQGITDYKLRKVEVVENEISRRSGWDPEAKELAKLRSALNRGEYPEGADELYYRQLMEYGDPNRKEAYLEHKIGQGMPWFWNKREADPSFAPWAKALSRNKGENIRLLFSQPYKQLKDAVEKQLIVNNQRSSFVKPVDKLITSIEDPASLLKGKGKNAIPISRRNNPGHITIHRAGSGQVVGQVGDYLAILYDPKFRTVWEQRKAWLMLDPNRIARTQDPWTLRQSIKPTDTFDSWRRRFIKERVEFIISQVPALKGRYKQTKIRSAIRQDIDWFFEDLFGSIPDRPDLDLDLRYVPKQIQDYLKKPSAARKTTKL